MKALVCAFNQEKALVGAFSVIVQPVVETMEHYTALVMYCTNALYYTVLQVHFNCHANFPNDEVVPYVVQWEKRGR